MEKDKQMRPNSGDTKEDIGRLKGETASLDGRLDRLEDTLDKGITRIIDKIDGQFKDCNKRFGKLETGAAVSTTRIGLMCTGVAAFVSAIVGGCVAWVVRATS